MSSKYTVVVAGYTLHAVAILLHLSLLQKFGLSHIVSSRPRLCVALFIFSWPIWGVALWRAAGKRKVMATVIPMTIGLVIMSPLNIFALGVLFDPHAFR